MVNEIKLDNINTYYTADNVDKNHPNQSSTQSHSKEAITVTNHLNELIKSCNSYEEPANDHKVSDIKSRIQNHEYQVDFDKLSNRLLQSGLIKTSGE